MSLKVLAARECEYPVKEKEKEKDKDKGHVAFVRLRAAFLEATRLEHSTESLSFQNETEMVFKRNAQGGVEGMFVQGWQFVPLGDLLEEICCRCLEMIAAKPKDGEKEWCPECLKTSAFHCKDCCPGLHVLLEDECKDCVKEAVCDGKDCSQDQNDEVQIEEVEVEEVPADKG